VCAWHGSGASRGGRSRGAGWAHTQVREGMGGSGRGSWASGGPKTAKVSSDLFFSFFIFYKKYK
jgi:hypothetical protein